MELVNLVFRKFNDERVGKFMKKFYIILIIVLSLSYFTGCSYHKTEDLTTNNDNISVITTIFPTYDFVRQIAKDKVDIKMLLKPGEESHSYEPTPKDIKSIQSSDLFIYVGGENDIWIEDILNSMGEYKPHTLKLLDIVPTLEEEIVPGMQHEDDHTHAENEDHNHHKTIDEHVWTSPKNAILIVNQISNIISQKDPVNVDFYNKNTQEYVKNLEILDNQFRNVVANSARKTMLFGDRFPFIYFANEYGLDYYAAFSGCSTETEASPKTIAFLIDKVNQENIPVVFTIEFSNGEIADSIVESTNAKKLLFNSCHNLTKEQLEQGATYLSLMNENVQLLKEALN